MYIYIAEYHIILLFRNVPSYSIKLEPYREN